MVPGTRAAAVVLLSVMVGRVSGSLYTCGYRRVTQCNGWKGKRFLVHVLLSSFYSVMVRRVSGS